ncbi:MAG: PP2C family protein-serine/threonine phosphatase [Vicingaceae bacterium]|nr:PP2C family protein-serine/threonine phosphatase [Vicingaceae bacterium]
MSKVIRNKNKRIQLGKLKLDILLQVTKSINNNLSKNELIQLYKNVVIDQLNIGKLLLYAYDGVRWQQEICVETGCKSVDVELDLLGFNEITFIDENAYPKLAEFDVVIPVYHKSNPIAYLLLADFDGESIEVSPIIKHLTFIQTLTNVIAVALENKRLFKENLEKIAIKKEMELASEMQALLFPNYLPNNNKIEVAAEYISNQLVGGDYYDFIVLSENEFAFCVADVSGKGVSAALLMSNFQAGLRTLIDKTDGFKQLVSELNTLIINNAKTEKFITAFIGKYNCETKKLCYINAGHNPPILINNNEIDYLTEGTTVIGMFDELPTIESGEITLNNNALLLCYTDGITEQFNIQNQEFGIDKLTALVKKNQQKEVNSIIQIIIDELNKFNQSATFDDDITLLGIRFK